MRKTILICLLATLFIVVLAGLAPAQKKAAPSVVPIPLELANLPTIKAEPWLNIEDNPATFLEGPAFDRNGNLYVTSVYDGRIFKITQDKKVSTIFNNKSIKPDGLAIHKDGRLFAACLSGELLAMNTDGSNVTNYDAKYNGKPERLNDLVFDTKGNAYATDFTGTPANPTGGIYRYSADFKTVQPVYQGMASANGIALSPKGNEIWASETCRGTLLHLQLLEDGITLNPTVGANHPYHFTGHPGPDSISMDKDGNIYQAMVFQGRGVILNKSAIPIANIVIPGRDEGKHLGTTKMAFKPGTRDVYIMAWGNGGAWIYKFLGLAEGLKLFSHQE
jgi:lactonase